MTLVVKNPPSNARDIRDVDLIPGSGRSPGGRHGNLLQNLGLENPLDRGAWHGITKSRIHVKRLSTHAFPKLSSQDK